MTVAAKTRPRLLAVLGVVAAVIAAGVQVAFTEVRPDRPPAACGLLSPTFLDLALGEGHRLIEEVDAPRYVDDHFTSSCMWQGASGQTPRLRLIVRHYGWSVRGGPDAHLDRLIGTRAGTAVVGERYAQQFTVNGPVHAVQAVTSVGAYALDVTYFAEGDGRQVGVARMALLESLSRLKG